MAVAALARSLPSGIKQKLQNDPRLAKLVHGSLSGVVGRGLGMVVSAITLPLTIRYLGRDAYGIWVTISTTVVMLAILDLGISSTLTNFIARAHAEDNKPAAQQYFASAFWITAAIAALLAGTGALCWHWIPWAGVFGIHDPAIAREASRSVAISFGFFLLNLPLSLGNRVLGGYQEVQTSNYFAMFSNVLGMVAIVGGVWARVSLSGLMLCYCLAILSGNLLMNLWLWFIGKPWLRPAFSAIKPSLSQELFGEGFLFFILQIAGLVVFNSDNLVITHYLGAGEVTPYSVAARLMGYAAMLQGLLVPAMWPAFSDAYHKGELGWIRATYRRVFRGTLFGVTALALGLTFSGQWIIRVWATRAAVPSMTLLAAMGVWAVILSISTNQASLLAATQRLRLQAVAGTLAAIFNLAGTIYLVHRMGAVGVILATIVSYLIFIILPQGWEVRNVLRGRYRMEILAGPTGVMLLRLRQIITRSVAASAYGMIRGPVFRRFAPQSPAAGPGPLRIAVVDLVPTLGDSVMIFPLLDALQREQPQAIIDIFGTGGGEILALHPAVHRYFQHRKTRPWAKRIGVAADVIDMLRDWHRHWRGLHYHVCFVPRGGADPLQSAHLAWLLGGAKRIGYSRRLEPERKSFDTDEDTLFTDLVTHRSGTHEVTRGAEVLALVNLLTVPVPLDQVSGGLTAVASGPGALAFLAAHPELQQPYALVAPGASADRRRWTEESFAKLAQLEVVPRGWLTVLAGSPAERDLCERIAAAIDGPTLIPTGTTFPELVALCKGARIFIGNDSGTGHVAGAVGTPTLEATSFASSGDPFHHASPTRSHPCGPFVRVMQPEHQLSPCTRECNAEEIHCITQVTVEQMREGFRALLAQQEAANA